MLTGALGCHGRSLMGRRGSRFAACERTETRGGTAPAPCQGDHGQGDGRARPQNHRALDSDRTVVPYRRDPTIAGKVSLSTHPAYRPQSRALYQTMPAGATSRDLAEHEVQSQYVANELDAQRRGQADVAPQVPAGMPSPTMA